MKSYFQLLNPLWLCATLILVACGTAVSPAAPTQPVSEPATETPATEESEAEPMPSDTPESTSTPVPFELHTSAFGEGEVIPADYACTGEDLSPELTWGAPPTGTQSYVLLFDDPDAFGWVHWLLFNLPPELRGVPEGVEDGAGLPDGSLQGATSWGTRGYRGPCPPAGTPHTYVFTLYALDALLSLDVGADVDAVQLAMDGHVLAQIQYTGEFSR